MTDDQAALLRDKYVLWERASREGPVDLRDYNRRAAEALKAALMIVSEYLQPQTSQTEVCRVMAANPGLAARLREAAVWLGDDIPPNTREIGDLDGDVKLDELDLYCVNLMIKAAQALEAA